MDTQDDIDLMENEPIYWFNKSSNLRGAAAALDFCMENQEKYTIPELMGLDLDYDMVTGTYGVYRMLCGMSLELLYKAIIIAQGGKYKPTHRLVDLAETTGLEYNNDELYLLDILTECIIWEGRYPTPNRNKVETLDYFTWLTFENLYYKEKISENEWMLQPKQPNPLNWNGFNNLWLKGSELFSKLIS
jgi:hypothetical protein